MKRRMLNLSIKGWKPFNPPPLGWVDETEVDSRKEQRMDSFNPPALGWVDETSRGLSIRHAIAPFNPPALGWVDETAPAETLA